MEVVRDLPEKKHGLDALMRHYSGSPGADAGAVPPVYATGPIPLII